MKRPSITRVVLPAVAAAATLGAATLVVAGQPDGSRADPLRQPLAAPKGHTRYGLVAAAGVVEPSSELIEVGSQVEGVITRVLVAPGERVVRGQLLFEVDGRNARGLVNEARADVLVARTRLSLAAAELTAADRQLGLYTDVDDPRAVAQQHVIERRSQREQAAARLAVARAELAAAGARLASAQTTVALREVRAPASGEVLQVRARPGEYAGAGVAGEPLMVLGETSPLHFRIDVDETEIDRTALGAPAIISPRGNASRRLWAAFVRAEPLVIPKRSLTNGATERVDVRVLQLIYALPNRDKDLFVGQQVDAYIPAKKLKAQ